MGWMEVLDSMSNMGLHCNFGDRMKRAYMKLTAALCDMEPSVILPLQNVEELEDLHWAVRFDNPELMLVWQYEKSSYSPRKTCGIQNEMSVYPAYRGSQEEVKRRLERVEKKVDEIFDVCLAGGAKTDDEVTRALCAYLATHYRYAKMLPGGDYPDYAYTLELLLYGEGVCSGFSSVLTYMLKKLQIPVMTAIGWIDNGESGEHAWNIIQRSDGAYRHTDVTWDAGKSFFLPAYFSLDDRSMRAKRHNWRPDRYPECR